MHLERIGDNVELLVRAAATMIREGIPSSERAIREVNRGIEWHTRQIAQKLAGPGF